MSLIENELNKLKVFLDECASKGEVYEFPMPDKVRDSYYIDYTDSKHVSSPIMNYDSETTNSFRKGLTMLWDKENKISMVIPIIIAAYLKTQKTETEIKEIDLYNYMM